jgi:PBP1b-binding outer membrane lipoprotein LpoB
MKKILLVICLLFFLVGCSKQQIIQDKKNDSTLVKKDDKADLLTQQQLALEKAQKEIEELKVEKKLSDSDIFKKKQECVSYSPNIEKKIKELDFRNENIVVTNMLDEIWFSPSRNSCLYSSKGFVEYLKKDITQWEYSIHDYLENKNLFYTWDDLNKNSYLIFESKKEELKK